MTSITEAEMKEEAIDRKHVFLVDGSGFIFRAFHALPPMSRDDGTPTNAVFGFTNMLIKLIEDLKADHCAIIFDTARKTFRNDVYKEYKANRPPPPDELIPQFALIREAVRAFNIACIEMEGYEADDLIATYTQLAREQDADVTIVSSDKDLMQLVGPNIKMFDPMKSKDISVEDVIEKFGVGPQHVVDVQALAGDTSDNVPGVPGIGIKTAAQLINEYGDLESLLDQASEKKRENYPNYKDSKLENVIDRNINELSKSLVAESLPDGVSNGNIITSDSTDDTRKWLIENNQKRIFPTLATFWGSAYAFSELVTLSISDINNIPDGDPID